MKYSRKMQRHIEGKIRHAMATGSIPSIARGSATGDHTRQALEKTDGVDLGQSK
jgi:hypothetical protein